MCRGSCLVRPVRRPLSRSTGGGKESSQTRLRYGRLLAGVRRSIMGKTAGPRGALWRIRAGQP